MSMKLLGMLVCRGLAVRCLLLLERHERQMVPGYLVAEKQVPGGMQTAVEFSPQRCY